MYKQKPLQGVIDLSAMKQYATMGDYFNDNQIVEQRQKDLINAVMMSKRSKAKFNQPMVLIEKNLADIVSMQGNDKDVAKTMISEGLALVSRFDAEKKFEKHKRYGSRNTGSAQL